MSHINCTTDNRKNKHLTERERYEIEVLLRENLKPIEIAARNTLDNLEMKLGESFKEKFKTITVDNGSEFLDFKGLESSREADEQRVKVYYAHPYSSWERGTNENGNKLIRHFIPKGADIGYYTHSEIKRIVTYTRFAGHT